MIVKNYFCAVEGQQEEIYLRRVQSLLTQRPKKILNFNIAEGNAEKLNNYFEYDHACLFDHDCNKAEFENNLKTCVLLNAKNRGTRKKPGVKYYHAYSSICFDLWLVLHKKYLNRSVSYPDGYVKDVINLYSLDKEADIKSKSVMEKIVKQIEIDDIKAAISNAGKIRKSKFEKDKIFVSGTNEFYYDNPDFSLDLFMQNVLTEMGY